MDAFFFAMGGLVFGIFIFKRELLVAKQTFRPILAICSALFLGSIAVYAMSATPPPGIGALLCPLLSLLVYRLCRKVFLARVGHEPRDTYLNWAPGLGPDRVFNIIFVALTLCLWIFTALVLG